MAGGHFIGSDGDGLAVNFDSTNGVDKSIEFKEILWWWFDFYTWFRNKWIINFIFLILILILILVLSNLLFFSFNEDFIRLSNKHSTEVINLIRKFRLYFRKFSKIKISPTAPVKTLHWELITSFKI